jgi:hypothetical protein
MQFSEFLLSRELLSEKDLQKALKTRNESQRPIGKFAAELGYIDRSDNIRILLAQSKTKKRYGELALEMSLLNNEQIGQILEIQEQNTLALGKVLVSMGILTRKEHITALRDYVSLEKDNCLKGT